jgi:hypothetical protein
MAVGVGVGGEVGEGVGVRVGEGLGVRVGNGAEWVVKEMSLLLVV